MEGLQPVGVWEAVVGNTCGQQHVPPMSNITAASVNKYTTLYVYLYIVYMYIVQINGCCLRRRHTDLASLIIDSHKCDFIIIRTLILGVKARKLNFIRWTNIVYHLLTFYYVVKTFKRIFLSRSKSKTIYSLLLQNPQSGADRIWNSAIIPATFRRFVANPNKFFNIWCKSSVMILKTLCDHLLTIPESSLVHRKDFLEDLQFNSKSNVYQILSTQSCRCWLSKCYSELSEKLLLNNIHISIKEVKILMKSGFLSRGKYLVRFPSCHGCPEAK